MKKQRFENIKGPRFYTENRLDLNAGTVLALPPDESNHISRVRRLKKGDLINITDGEGGTALAIIVCCHPNEVQVKITTLCESQQDLAPVEVIMALIKGERMEWAISKAAELGVCKIHPVFTENCVVKKDGQRLEKRLEKWKNLCRQALKQCRGNFITEINRPVNLQDCIYRFSDENSLIALVEDCREKSINQAWKEQGFKLPACVIIGPEGGFSMAEKSFFKEKKISAASLGTRILRSETAVVAAASIMKSLIADKQ